MARPLRLEAENTFYHLTNRGDGRKKIYASEYDNEKFLEYVLQAKKRFKFRLYAYVLMCNHYHLFVETLLPNLSKIMHFINSSYTTYYNTKRNKSGHLFQGRYKSVVVDTDSYFLELTRYIHLNPVKAGIVKLPEEYKWSSYKAYLGKAEDKYIDREAIKERTDLWGRRYEDFVMTAIDQKEDLFKDIYGGVLLGNTAFIKEKLKEMKGQVKGKHISHKDDLKGYVEKGKILKLMKNEYGKDSEHLKIRSRNGKERKIAIYLMRELTGLNNSEIGEIFDMNFSAVSKAALSIEIDIKKDKGLRKEVGKLICKFDA